MKTNNMGMIFLLKFREASHMGNRSRTFGSHLVPHDPLQDPSWKSLKSLIGGSKEGEVTLSSEGFQDVRRDGGRLEHRCAFRGGGITDPRAEDSAPRLG